MDHQKPPQDETLRRLVCCPACEVQYDVSNRPAGSRFHCGCGHFISVPDGRPHNAAVIRCSSCGAPRQGKSLTCGFCHSHFTLHEQDLHTICPKCMTRIGDRARFCHSCGISIIPQGAGEDSDQHCPVCPESHLVHRKLGDQSISVQECGRCGGLWLGHELFGLLQERALSNEVPWLAETDGAKNKASLSQIGPVYRRCVACGKQMSRRNFERQSGVIIDVCPGDGVWLDVGELDRILRWIQKGGLSAARQRTVRKERERQQLRQFRRPSDPLVQAEAFEFGDRDRKESGDFLGGVIDFLLNN